MDQVGKVRETIDLVSLISEFIELKQMGRNFKSPCPFHSEKTPSFVVSPERQIWHCFGCQKGGDCFTFLMEYEHIDFPESLRILAKRAGIELVAPQHAKETYSKKEKLYILNKIALEFYHYILTTHPVGKTALSYVLNDRKINRKVVDTFMLGFAPKSGTALTSYLLQKKKYTKDDLLDAGLATIRSGRVVDFFANRLMFPLTDHRENVLGFSGRILDADAFGPKYVNTRETILYHKGSTFFGLHITKEHIQKEKKVLLMEGEFDVLSSFQEGVSNVVAVKGTALTESQVLLMKRFTSHVLLCFDTDAAGQEALKRSVSVLEAHGFTIHVVDLLGKDPDETIHSDSAQYKTAIKHAIPVYDFLLEKTMQQFDPKTADGKKTISSLLLSYIVHIDNDIVKEHYLRKLAGVLDTSFESMSKQAEKQQQKQKTPLTAPAEVVPLQKRDRQEGLEAYVLALLVQRKTDVGDFKKVVDELKDVSFIIGAHQKIIAMLKDYFEQYTTFDSSVFVRLLPTELLESFDTCFLRPISEFPTQKEWQKEILQAAADLRQVSLKNHIKIITEQIKQEEKNGGIETVETLQKELTRLLALYSKKAT